jgi:hypothetical protein
MNSLRKERRVLLLEPMHDSHLDDIVRPDFI